MISESILRWLDECYTEIVQPMTISLKKIMQDFLIVNEAELFCSDLEFKVSKDSITKLCIRDGSRNSRKVRMGCDDRLFEIVQYYKEVRLMALIKKVAETD